MLKNKYVCVASTIWDKQIWSQQIDKTTCEHGCFMFALLTNKKQKR